MGLIINPPTPAAIQTYCWEDLPVGDAAQAARDPRMVLLKVGASLGLRLVECGDNKKYTLQTVGDHSQWVPCVTDISVELQVRIPPPNIGMFD